MLSGYHELEKALKLRNIPPRKKELQDSDLVILHTALAASSVDDLDAATILVNHGSCREFSFFYEEQVKNVDPMKKYFLEKDKSDIRSKMAELFRKPDVTLSNSKFIQQQVKNYFGVDTRILYPPVNRERFSPTSDDGDYFVSAQRMDWAKRVDAQIEAFKDIDEELKIIGTGTYSESVKRECAKHDNIDYLGYVSNEELVKHYSAAKAVIQTAVMEDFGLVPREAMACGTPVITGAEGGFKEIPSYCGVKFNPASRIRGLKDAVRGFDDSNYDSKELRAATEKYSYSSIKKRLDEEINIALGE